VLSAAHPGASVHSLLALARAYVAVGDPSGAQTVLAQAREIIRLRPRLGVLPGEVSAFVDELASRAPMVDLGVSSLTVAELRVLRLLPYYLSFKEIGQRLGVKESTVKTHATSIYGKLGASMRGEAVELAVRAGLLQPFAAASVSSSFQMEALAPGT
jgi:LuxR family maltose regulon positive regulatory protein